MTLEVIPPIGTVGTKATGEDAGHSAVLDMSAVASQTRGAENFLTLGANQARAKIERCARTRQSCTMYKKSGIRHGDQHGKTHQ